MTGVRDVDAGVTLHTYLEFADEICVRHRDWVDTVKTGHGKEFRPSDQDWFYVRCAAIARHLDLKKAGRVGVGRLPNTHGEAKKHGSRSGHHVRGSGAVNRKAIQALEKLHILELNEEMGGWLITAQGQRDLDRVTLAVTEAAAGEDDSSDA
ncbi:ribosomal protein S19e [Clathrospora elynae]|uniref:Ribosomal protein S19e n=1 Tax=Clathrospora elynae TaxID=706981 RepID=A0A6A5T024_9PLEO|nr:ribosomal protein S19e [Clathrospora elynae]